MIVLVGVITLALIVFLIGLFASMAHADAVAADEETRRARAERSPITPTVEEDEEK